MTPGVFCDNCKVPMTKEHCSTWFQLRSFSPSTAGPDALDFCGSACLANWAEGVVEEELAAPPKRIAEPIVITKERNA